MSEFDLMGIAAAGMDAQRAALDLAARNVAASEAAPGDGKSAFERLIPRFAIAPDPAETEAFEPPAASNDPDDPDADDQANAPIRYLGASVERGVDADAVTEMVAVLDAQRAFDANASVFDLAKRLSERTIDLERLQ